MTDVPRIDVHEARRRVQAGKAVCAYDDEAKCDALRLEGAISLGELLPRLGSLPHDQELILYCA